jgi:hypothetical protein
MLNLKKRVECLLSATRLPEVREACNSALSMFPGSFIGTTPYSQVTMIEETIVSGLIEKIETVNEDITRDFVNVEKRILGINNLGVRNAIKAVMEDDLSKHVSVRYTLEGIRRLQEFPEWSVAETAIESLSQFEWSPIVREQINILKNNINKYSEDIKIYKAVAEAKATNSSYLMSGVEKELDAYLNRRTSTNRAKLMESLSKFSFDAGIKNLYNVISESANGFQIKADSKDAYFKKVYSPVHVYEGTEYFTVFGKAFAKKGNEINEMSSAEMEYLPEGFIWLADFLIQPNVEVSESGIKIFSRDKKVEIVDESGAPVVKVNGRSVNAHDFEKVYLNSGIFNVSEKEVLNSVYRITENWNSIMELDFIKSIFSHSNPYRRIDIFRCNEKIHMNKIDTMMNENVFIADCNGTQSRNLVLEFLNYDLGNTFKDLLTKEETRINEFENEKKSILEAISYLEVRKTKIDELDQSIRESSEIKDIYEAITDEIDDLKASYSAVEKQRNSFTSLAEGVGVKTNDEVEFEKKKQR